MQDLTKTPEDIARSRAFVALVTGQKLMDVCEISPQHLYAWKVRGISKPWAMFLRLRFPRQWREIFGDLK